MNKKEVEQRIKELRLEVIKHDIAFASEKQTITDEAYDRLYMELVDLEINNPEFDDIDSPTQKIYDIVIAGLEKVKHSTPMLSQDKIADRAGIEKFLTKIKDEILVQQKLDGLTVVLTYENGVLSLGVTRGNGAIGEKITHIMLNTINVPKKIEFEGKLELRGEAIIPNDDFNRINAPLPLLEKYKSSRNLASGTVRNLQGKTAKERGLKFIAFDLVSVNGKEFTKDVEQLEFLSSLGFDIVPYELFPNTEEGKKSMVKYIEAYNENIRQTLDYKIDGLVLKTNDLEQREELGYTSKYPRWATAYKFESLDATTKLLDVIFTTGKIGQITPKAIFEPVEIDGVTIKQASLSNFDDIVRRGLKIGDTIIVERAKDVIPKVTSVVLECRTGTEKEIELITTCPSCGELIGKEVNANGEEGVNYFCNNSDCPAQLQGKIEHFVSRNAMNITGLGEKTIEQLIEKNIISSIVDIYNIKDHIPELLTIDKFAEKKIDNLLKGIEDSKTVELQNVLLGLTIRYIGDGGAKRLANHYVSMNAILDKAQNEEEFYNDLISIEDVGSATAESVVQFFSLQSNMNIIDKFIEYGLTMKQEVKETTESFFTGKIVVVTGTLENFGRKEIKAKLESLGAKVSGSVSKKTDYVLYGAEAGSKLTTAIDLGIKTITESEFEDMIK